MTDKERLEYIKNSYLKGIHSLLDTPWVSMPKENFDFLIQQAERTQKIEQILEDMDRQLYSEQQQNKRYKQALELIYKDTFYESENDLVSPIHVIRKRAEKVLEESLND